MPLKNHKRRCRSKAGKQSQSANKYLFSPQLDDAEYVEDVDGMRLNQEVRNISTCRNNTDSSNSSQLE